jgi:diadenosine tetraphosphate (Ap4A) HIT family hydrolase
VFIEFLLEFPLLKRVAKLLQIAGPRKPLEKFFRNHFPFFYFFQIHSNFCDIIPTFEEINESFHSKLPSIMEKNPDCLYCTRNQLQHDLMIEICDLTVSTLFLFKEQTYRGRCVVAYKDHQNELFELVETDRNAFMADVTKVAKALSTAFNAVKINMGAYSDKLQHLHFHLAPKYVDGPDYGGIFQMNPQKVYLTDAEYAEVIASIKAEL